MGEIQCDTLMEAAMGLRPANGYRRPLRRPQAEPPAESYGPLLGVPSAFGRVRAVSAFSFSIGHGRLLSILFIAKSSWNPTGGRSVFAKKPSRRDHVRTLSNDWRRYQASITLHTPHTPAPPPPHRTARVWFSRTIHTTSCAARWTTC